MNFSRTSKKGRKRRRQTLTPVALLFSLVLGNGCRQPSPRSQYIPVRMAIGSQTEMVYLASTLAQQLGYYEQEGLNVAITDTAGGSKALEALLGGSADVVTGFYDHTIQMAAEGKSIQAFVTMVRYPGAVAVLSPEGAKKIHRLEDLKGATAGVTAPGSSSHFFLNFLLAKHGLSPNDVSVIGLGGSASRVMAMERSKVDLGILFEPSVTQLLRRSPSALILADTRTREGVQEVYGTATYPSAVLYTPTSWLKQNPESARHLARAIQRTLAWIQEHSPEQIMDKMPASFRGDNPAFYLEALQHSLPMFSPDGIMTPEGAEAVRKVLAVSSEKVRTAKIDLAATYTNKFLLERQK
jgi:NitT/TauT family transport system substrate-binding protein